MLGTGAMYCEESSDGLFFFRYILVPLRWNLGRHPVLSNFWRRQRHPFPSGHEMKIPHTVPSHSRMARGFSYIVSRFYNVPGTFPVGRRSTTFFFPGEFSERSQPTWMDVGVLGCWGRGTYILAGTLNGCVRPYYREYT